MLANDLYADTVSGGVGEGARVLDRPCDVEREDTLREVAAREDVAQVIIVYAPGLFWRERGTRVGTRFATYDAYVYARLSKRPAALPNGNKPIL